MIVRTTDIKPHPKNSEIYDLSNIDDLVESHGDEIAELHFHHGFFIGDAQAESGTDDGGFAERCIPNPILAETLHKPFGDFEHASIVSDILSH